MMLMHGHALAEQGQVVIHDRLAGVEDEGGGVDAGGGAPDAVHDVRGVPARSSLPAG